MLLILFITSFFSYINASEVNASKKLSNSPFTINEDGTMTALFLSSDEYNSIITDPEKQIVRRNAFYKAAYENPARQAKFGKSIYAQVDQVHGYMNSYGTLTSEANLISLVFPTAFISRCQGEDCPYTKIEEREKYIKFLVEDIFYRIENFKKTPLHLVFHETRELGDPTHFFLEFYKQASAKIDFSAHFVVHCIHEMYHEEPIQNVIDVRSNPGSKVALFQIKEKISQEQFYLMILKNNFKRLVQEAKAKTGIFPCNNINVEEPRFYSDAQQFLDFFHQEQSNNNPLYNNECDAVLTGIDFNLTPNPKPAKDFLLLAKNIRSIVAAVAEISRTEAHVIVRPVITNEKKVMEQVLTKTIDFWNGLAKK